MMGRRFTMLRYLRNREVLGATLTVFCLILSFRVIGLWCESRDERFNAMLHQALVSFVALLMYGAMRGLTLGGLHDRGFIHWLRRRPWKPGDRIPFAPMGLCWEDIAVAALLVAILPLNALRDSVRLEWTLWTLAYFVTTILVGMIVFGSAGFWKARHWWPIYLGVAAIGAMILFVEHVAQVPLAVGGLYCVFHSQLPTVLRRAFVDDALRCTTVDDPWMRRRRRPGVDEPELPLDELPLAPKFPVPSIPYALATGVAIAWLSFAPLNRFPGAELFRLYLMMSFGLGVVALAHVWLAWLQFRLPPIRTRLKAGAWRPMQGLRLYAMRFGSLALCAIAFSLIAKRDASLAAPIALTLGAAWTLLRLRNCGLESLRLTGPYQIA